MPVDHAPGSDRFIARADDSPGNVLAIGGLLSLGLLVAALAWASTMTITSAGVAAGRVTVEGNRKAVQHHDGGPVEVVYVHEGQLVNKGDRLLKLDLSELTSQAAVLETSNLQSLARVARLRAEADGAATFTIPDELANASDPQAAIFARQELDLFTARQQAYLGSVSLLQQRIEGAKQQILSIKGRIRATTTQLSLVQEEASMVAKLFAKDLVTKPRKLQIDRTAAELEGNLDEAQALLDAQDSSIREAEIQIAQLQKDRQEQVSKDRSDAEASLSEVQPQLRSVRERLARGTLVSPERGYVFGLTVFGPGAVVTPGQTVLEIVPADEPRVLTVEISPRDIDKVHPGQAATVRLVPYHQGDYIINGTLSRISSDQVQDKVRQTSYFEGIVTINSDDASRPDAQMVPGMPAEIMISTGTRTIMGYILDPVTRMYDFAMRDS